MQQQLLISGIVEYAAKWFSDQKVVSVTSDGQHAHFTYKETANRVRQLANALQAAGVTSGDRIATMAWNDHRHLELYYGISGLGAVCHTLNPRLAPDQLIYILNHAEDSILFVDPMFIKLIEAVKDQAPALRQIVVLCGDDHLPDSSLDIISYESFIASHDTAFSWPEFDENTAASLCYTSGTTGNPKGVLYSHRSTLLHSWAAMAPNALQIGMVDSILPVVPLFHVNAWGIPYAAMMAGAKIVMPGPKLDGESLYALLEDEKVTITAGVPTVWLGLKQYLEANDKVLHHVQRMVVGGSAAPSSMIEYFEETHDLTFLHAWGMTEMSPVGTVCILKPEIQAADRATRTERQLSIGLPVYGVDLKVEDEAGNELPHDGETSGELFVRGPWITKGYFRNDDANKGAFDADGWFGTGDVVTIDAEGYVRITDRAKDVIKSGGEWISSIDVENVAMSHPDVAQAAVIGLYHEKWQERPLLLLVPNEAGKVISKAEMDAHFGDKIAKWWYPDAVEMVTELPIGATGKIQKRKLRDDFKDYRFPA